uniref:Estrogen receptor 2 n=1 Tax=Pavo cristatus TaxID=9049 RepID=A0A8C9FZ98_PAVCR
TKPGKCVEGILEIFDMLLAMTSRFRELKLQHKEYLCVKAMILLNSSEYTIASDTHQIVLISTEAGKLVKLHHLLNVVTDALVWVIAKSGIPSQQQTTRLANLLMLLSHVRHQPKLFCPEVPFKADAQRGFWRNEVRFELCACRRPNILCILGATTTPFTRIPSILPHTATMPHSGFPHGKQLFCSLPAPCPP